MHTLSLKCIEKSFNVSACQFAIQDATYLAKHALFSNLFIFTKRMAPESMPHHGDGFRRNAFVIPAGNQQHYRLRDKLPCASHHLQASLLHLYLLRMAEIFLNPFCSSSCFRINSISQERITGLTPSQPPLVPQSRKYIPLSLVLPALLIESPQ